jgi:hypothetical protein
VLKGVEAEVGEARYVMSRRVDAEDSALIAWAVPVWEPLGQWRERTLPDSEWTAAERRAGLQTKASSESSRARTGVQPARADPGTSAF